MSRLLAHLLLLLYAGLFLQCQPLPARAAATAASYGSQQKAPRTSFCKKKLQSVQANPLADFGQRVKAKLPPLDLSLGDGLAALYLGRLFPADKPVLTPTRGPNLGPGQAFANHPNKAPPVCFS
ncbi:hypothetical protein J7E24_07375 [Hymenobacter sp. ISL-91]|uniref:hypothetical protein n=1 Tax=Hymenobacter sp. ISL-91 TaxID=2819151 RepID=UPI001BE96DD8|nr:hypothetical protein [Hymenobacter sp. ISL-91]MBT2557599.1 hypothetical protein [Hymenobacter sp. ISL-91]